MTISPETEKMIDQTIHMQEAIDRSANHVVDLEQEIAAMIDAAVRAGIENEPRTAQSRAGLLGPSDIGFCRQKAVLTAREVQPTDSSDPWAAAVGVAVHKHVEGFLDQAFGDSWIIEKRKVTATLPQSGAQISGTADIIIPDRNLVLDIKTVDGLKKVQTYGPSQSHMFQRHLYAMGALDAGLFDPQRQVYVGNVYIDVSRGNHGEPKVWVTIAPMDDSLTDEIDSWVSDVIYAVHQQEDASRDIAAPICERFCEFFTHCRGALPMRDSEPLDDPEILQAVDLYVQGREMAKTGDAMKKEAQSILIGLNGSTGEWQVRTVVVGEQDVPGFTRKASTRLDVRRVRRK